VTSGRLVVVALAAAAGAGACAACGGSGRSTAPLVLADPGGAGSAAAAAAPGEAPFASPGERMSYRLAIHGVEVAAFAIAVGEVGDVEGRAAIAVEAGVQSTGIGALFKQVRTEFASWIDVGTGRPVVSRVTETAGADNPAIEVSEVRYVDLKPGAVPIAMTAPDGTQTVEDQVIEGVEVWDVPSILFQLRGWDADVGAELSAQVVRSRYVWRGRFRIAGRESRSTELGQIPTVRVEGIARRILRDGTWEPKGDQRAFTIWITDDADRVPVLIVGHTDFGDVRMEIVEYAAGQGNLRARAGTAAQ
jgi:hypothetical protein